MPRPDLRAAPGAAWGPVALLPLLLLLALITAPAARADPRTDALARALLRDPVYVSPSLVRVAPAADVRALRAAVARAPYPVYVAVLPTFGAEDSIPTARPLPAILHDRMGRDGLYLIVDQSSFSYAGAFGVRIRRSVDELFSDVYDDRPGQDPVATATYALGYLEGAPRRAIRDPRDAPGRGTARNVLAVLVGLLVGAAVLRGLSAPWWAEQRARRAARARTRERDAPAAEALDPAALEEAARTELAKLSRELAGADDPPPVAFDDYAAASKVLEDHEHPIDLLGALILAWRGQAALEGGTARPCLFDPRHGPGRTTTRWRLDGGEVDIPACRACAKAIAAGRAPQAVQDRGRDYFTRDTVWARTGFGALDDTVAQQVMTGAVRG